MTDGSRKRDGLRELVVFLFQDMQSPLEEGQARNLVA